MGKNLSLLSLVGSLFLLLIVACSQSDKSIEKINNASNEQRKADELILAIGSEPDEGFDPVTGWGRYGSPLFQSTILKRDNDLNIDYDLAKNYQIINDGLVWVVELREDVKFSDGEPLTAADVEYTFKKAMESGSVLDFTNLESVKVVDDFQVEFTLKEPQSTFIHALITTGIVPKHAHGEGYAEHPLGSGPFTFVQWDKGQQLIVEANPLYYGEKPLFNKLTFLFLNEDAAFAAAKAGQVDMVAIPAAFSKQEIPGMRLESLQSVDNRGITFPYVKSGKKTAAGHPIGNDVTADLAIRQAINLAIDRNLLVEGILEGYGTPAYTVADGLPWWNPETVFKDANIEEAQKQLSEAGWKDSDGDGVLEKGALKAEFTLIYPASDSLRQSLAISVVDMMKPLGITIHAEGKSWDDIEMTMHSNAVLFGWGSHDPLEMYNLYSSNWAGVGYYNSGFYSNPIVDDYMEKALAATSEDEALEYWKKAQWDGETGFSNKGDAPWAWLVNLDHLYLVNENLDIGVQKIQPHGHGWPVTDNIADWKWNE